MSETRSGILSDYLFYNEENGYAVFLLETEDGLETVVGHLPYVTEGERLRVWGEFSHHSKYGRQLKMEGYETLLPTGAEAIETYLGSGMIEGIGPQLAHRIVRKFGDSIFDILDFSPERLTEVPGIGAKKLEGILESWKEQRQTRNIMMELQKLQISNLIAMKIYKFFGDDAVEQVRDNPYQLAEWIHGFGFRQADFIANNMGIGRDSPFRIRSGLHHTMMKQISEGHTCFPRHLLVSQAATVLEVDERQLEPILTEMILDGTLYSENLDDAPYVYLAPYYMAEAGIVKRLAMLMSQSERLPLLNREKIIREIEEQMNLSLAPEQIGALETVLDQSVVVITGGPGTGKTTLVRFVIELLERSAHRIALAAPTGRAAKRLSQTTNRDARTLHRLLEYIPPAQDGDDGGFQRDENNPLDLDVLIVDELSMVDVLLMNHLLKAIPPGGRLILVGDADQLHSVGSGNVLRDLIASGSVPVARLEEIFRQARESAIVVNAHRINHGEMPVVNERDKDFFFIEEPDAKSIQKTVIDLASRRLPQYYGLDPMKDIQILSPMKQSPVGVEALNQCLQAELNPLGKQAEKQLGTRIFRENDRVMQIKNNYSQRWIAQDTGADGEGVFNGDIGIIARISKAEQTIHVLFDDERLSAYDFAQVDELIHAYAITVHKSQGSEFPAVVMPISGHTPILMTRNLLYTAVTRARRLVVLVGDRRWLQSMVRNNTSAIRHSGLRQRLAALSEWMEEDV